MQSVFAVIYKIHRIGPIINFIFSPFLILSLSRFSVLLKFISIEMNRNPWISIYYSCIAFKVIVICFGKERKCFRISKLWNPHAYLINPPYDRILLRKGLMLGKECERISTLYFTVLPKFDNCAYKERGIFWSKKCL